jgi:hypothetical protein
MQKPFTFNEMINIFKEVIEKFPDKRTGDNVFYSLENVTLSAFSVFFTQSPSFLAYQKTMQEQHGKSNAQTLFEIKEIPTDIHTRDLLDPVNPELIFPVFDKVLNVLLDSGHLEEYRIFNGDLLVAIDGTWYYTSKNIHCDNCSTMKHKDGTVTYYHCVLTPVIVAPGKNKVIPLMPEFIVPQDGSKKQDCEINAGKRWIENKGKKYSNLGITLTGDDLYCHEPMCKKVLDAGFSFIFVCKPASHKTLYDWIKVLEEEKDLNIVTVTRRNGRNREIYTYKYANKVPIKDEEDALLVNWFEVTVTKEGGEKLYKNGFATDHEITDENIEALALYGRARWKIENENNNILKTKGYHLEHNYGHGKKNLSSLFASFIILAYLFHTLLDFMDDKYRLLRKKLPSRKTFFDDIRALTTYICFDSWEHLMNFMLQGLKSKIKLDTG